MAIAGLLLAASLFAACIPGGDGIDLDQVYAEALGGDTMAYKAASNAFELSARNLTNEERRTFEIGDSFFTQNWVAAPAVMGMGLLEAIPEERVRELADPDDLDGDSLR